MRITLLFGLLAVSGCDTAPKPGVVRLAFRVHVEGLGEDAGPPEDRPDKYSRHVSRLGELEGAVGRHGVVLTYEPELAYLVGEAAYLAGDGSTEELRTLADRVQAGHAALPQAGLFDWASACPAVYAEDGTGVGAYTDPAGQCPGGMEGLSTLRAAFEGVGLASPSAISGVCAGSDWMAMARAAGFSTISGTVGTCALTMAPEALATYEGDYSGIHADGCADPKDCHQQLPLEDASKLRAWRTSDVQHWLTPDPGGTLTIVPSFGDPRCMEEYASSPSPELPCAYTAGDVDAYFIHLNEAVAAAADGEDRSLVLTLSVGDALESDELVLLGEWARRAEADYVTPGLAAWASLEEAAATAE